MNAVTYIWYHCFLSQFGCDDLNVISTVLKIKLNTPFYICSTKFRTMLLVQFVDIIQSCLLNKFHSNSFFNDQMRSKMRKKKKKNRKKEEKF